MATFVGLFTGGTAGRQDGTLISPAAWVTSTEYAVADMVSNGGNAYQCIGAHTSGTFATDLAADKWVLVASSVAAFPEMTLDTPTEVMFRACAFDLSDPGEDSTSTLSPTLPTGFTGCFTEGGTYATSPTTDAVIAHGGNQSLWIQQADLVASSPVGLDLGAETFSTGTRVGQVTTFAASTGYEQSVLTWDAISGESGFIIEYCAGATDPGPASWAGETGYTATTAAADAVTKTITGLTNGTQYQFRIRAWAATGLGAWSTTASATPHYAVASISATVSSDTNGPYSTHSRHLVRDSAGNLYAAFDKKYSTIRNAYVAKSMDGGSTWAETLVSTTAPTRGALGTSIAVDGSGVVHATWLLRNSGNTAYEWMYAYYNGSWSTPEVVSNAKDWRFPAIAVSLTAQSISSATRMAERTASTTSAAQPARGVRWKRHRHPPGPSRRGHPSRSIRRAYLISPSSTTPQRGSPRVS